MSKLEVGGNAKEAGRVPVLAFSRGREVAAQMAAQPTSISGLEGRERQGQTLAGSTGIGFQTFLYPGAGGVRQLC